MGSLVVSDKVRTPRPMHRQLDEETDITESLAPGKGPRFLGQIRFSAEDICRGLKRGWFDLDKRHDRSHVTGQIRVMCVLEPALLDARPKHMYDKDEAMKLLHTACKVTAARKEAFWRSQLVAARLGLTPIQSSLCMLEALLPHFGVQEPSNVRFFREQLLAVAAIAISEHQQSFMLNDEVHLCPCVFLCLFILIYADRWSF